MSQTVRAKSARGRAKTYTTEEFYAFTESEEAGDKRYELFDGQIYMMAAPAVTHQRVVGALYRLLCGFFDGKTCEVFVSPVDVELKKRPKEWKEGNWHNVFQPDVFVVCDREKIRDKRIVGAPDLVIEVVSPSSGVMDYMKKPFVYAVNGVKEYWIVDPANWTAAVYNMAGKEFDAAHYTLDDAARSKLFAGLAVDFKGLAL